MSDAMVRASGTGDSVWLAVSGEVDVSNVNAIEAEITAAVTNLASEVVIDLTDVAYMDSSGVRMLFGLAQGLRTTRTDLVVRAPHGTVARRVLDLSGLSTVARLEPPDPDGGA
jgi:anti-anti-sigma factor